MGLLGWLTNLLPAIQGRVLLAEVVFGSIIISILIQLAWWIYQQKWGNGILSVLLAFVVILPIAPLIRRIYFPLLFRLVWFAYFILFIYLVVYTILIAYHHAKNKKDSDDLNQLIKRSKKKKD
jgi:phosphotransferase system  glucose/maltose/N-acetylglucosamine-specific IIC component